MLDASSDIAAGCETTEAIWSLVYLISSSYDDDANLRLTKENWSKKRKIDFGKFHAHSMSCEESHKLSADVVK